MFHSVIKKINPWAKVCIITMTSLLLLTSHPAEADNKSTDKSMQEWARAYLTRYFAWFNAPWTIGDSRYLNIRNSIDYELAKGQKPEIMLQKYKDDAEKQPSNPQSVFAYGYAVYKAATLPNAISEYEAFQEEGNFSLAWDKVHAPHTYNYVRLLFLEQSLGSPMPELIDVGKRLLARDPNDYEVEYGVALMANMSMKPLERSEAVAYQQDLARRYPQDPRQYRLLAEIYKSSAARSHKQVDADNTIAAYEQYLALAPEYKLSTQEQIRLMKELKVMWRNG